ncbi:MAG: hypothetical protein J1G06_03715 [Oscillospiraceae bacterium]|nr:hypothetical protein [Oscillospiraceae bacterium]
MKNVLLRRTFSVAIMAAFLGSVFPFVIASDLNGTKMIVCGEGENLTIGTYAESASKTRELIDSRPDIYRRMDDMGRGLVAVKTDNGVFVSWRWEGTESLGVKYNLYRNGIKLNEEPMSFTNYTDNDGNPSDKYSVSAVENETEGAQCEPVSVWSDGYLEIPLQRPENKPLANGDKASDYTPGDAAVADLDGDGEYEIVLKWNATALDAAKTGYTSECILDAYKLDGTRMWRINMGPNIRSGEHDTQFMVADFDNDGAAEMAVRTADGTIAGDGSVIGDADAKWYENNNGKNLDGPLYITVFRGSDGSIIDSQPFFPQSTGTYSDGTEWDISSWGDDWGNRSERYLGAIATFDGVTTSFIQARGCYDRSCMAAYHVENGKIVMDWNFDSKRPEYRDMTPSPSGQGYHNMATADVDYDGYDEVIYGNLVLDHDGTIMYSTGLGYGDSMHVGDLVPSRPGMEVYTCQENRSADYGFAMRDARTGEILYGIKTATDNGRACTADIDPRYEGEEAWSAYGVLTAADGTVISTKYSMPANFAIYWDGDLGREIEDGNAVYKWSVQGEEVNAIFKAVGTHSINATKSNPSIQADIFGDWREELIFPADDFEHLRIYTTTIPTKYRIPTLMSDSTYRNAVGWQNNCYNQTTHLGYYLGYDTSSVPVPQIYIERDGEKITNPDLPKKSWSISDLYFGDTVELVPGYCTALINGAKTRIDNDNAAVKPYVNTGNRTMVPIRFIAEAFGAEVNYNDETKEITISIADMTINMMIGETRYTVNTFDKPGKGGAGGGGTMDTAPEIVNNRTFVPVRAVAEALNKTVEYYDGLVYISTLDGGLDGDTAAAKKNEIINTAPAVSKNMSILAENYGDESAGSRLPVTVAATSDGTDGSDVIDYDLETSWVCPPGGSITLDNNGAPGVPAIVIAFGDRLAHHFRIEYSSDMENWQIGIAERISDGKPGQYEKFYFGVPPYTRYVKYVSLEETETVISEFANARIE